MRRASSSATTRLNSGARTLRLKCSTEKSSRSSSRAVSISPVSGFERLDGLARLEGDAGGAERGLDQVRRIMVDQPAVDHRLAVAVAVDRLAEDLRRMERGRRGQPDLDRVEILEHPPVLRDVVLLVAEGDLGIAHLPVEQVAAVAFVDQDQVILVDRRPVLRARGPGPAAPGSGPCRHAPWRRGRCRDRRAP